MRSRSELRRGAAFATLVALALATTVSTGVAGAEAPVAADVLVEDFVFQPDAVTIAVGGTVTWTLGADPDQHTITPRDPEQFEDSGQLFEGDTYEVTFDEAGTVDYFCRLHPTMTGTVTIVAAPSPTATTAPPETAATPSTTPTAAVEVSASPSAAQTATPVPAPPPAEEPGAFLLPLALAAAFAVAIVVALDWLRSRGARVRS
jgi:plastocyanin